jgi:tRNA(Ile)-lysidine synthase
VTDSVEAAIEHIRVRAIEPFGLKRVVRRHIPWLGEQGLKRGVMKQKPSGEWRTEALADLPNDSRYLIGVSGGRDSVVLLHWLLARGYRKLIVCHFEHGLRGRAGKADARFVERMLRGMSCHSSLAPPMSPRSPPAESNRSKLRRVTSVWHFFQKVARRRRCLTIFLAHHADDQVETFLFNLFRGAGGRGLGGMRPSSNFGSLQIVRPLLGVWRSQIDSYVRSNGLEFRNDATNEKLEARRQSDRHKIVPWLEKQFGRNIRKDHLAHRIAARRGGSYLESQVPMGLTTRN